MQKQPAIAPAAAKKRKAAADDSEPTGAFIDCTPQLRALKSKLSCQKHDRCFCFVSPVTSEHMQVGDSELGLWARKIVRFVTQII